MDVVPYYRGDLSQSRFTSLGVLVVVVAILAPVSVFGQTAPVQWTTPRTPDGQPDLQGIWANNVATPLERPEELAETATRTPSGR